MAVNDRHNVRGSVDSGLGLLSIHIASHVMQATPRNPGIRAEAQYVPKRAANNLATRERSDPSALMTGATVRGAANDREVKSATHIPIRAHPRNCAV